MNESSSGLWALVPAIRRTRAFRLYTAGGRRLVDLWQYGGAAVLGHTASGVLLVLKDTASRGLFAPFPHPASRRLEQALHRLIPDRGEIRLYGDEASADRALAAAGFPTLRDFADPALTDLPPGVAAAFWRPWAPQSDILPAVLAPFLPLPWPSRPVALLCEGPNAGRLPPSDILSPVVLAAAARAVDDLRTALPLRETIRFRRTDTALAEGCAWTRRGPYLRPSTPLSEEAYTALFRRFLESGFVLPPDPSSPAILPGELSAGEDAALAALLCRPTSEIL